MLDNDARRHLIEVAGRLDDDDLLGLIRGLTAVYKERRKATRLMAAAGLRPGDDVECMEAGRRLPAGALGHVCEVRRGGRVLVHFPEHGAWVVDATNLSKVGTVPRPPGGGA